MVNSRSSPPVEGEGDDVVPELHFDVSQSAKPRSADNESYHLVFGDEENQENKRSRDDFIDGKTDDALSFIKVFWNRKE